MLGTKYWSPVVPNNYQMSRPAKLAFIKAFLVASFVGNENLGAAVNPYSFAEDSDEVDKWRCNGWDTGHALRQHQSFLYTVENSAVPYPQQPEDTYSIIPGVESDSREAFLTGVPKWLMDLAIDAHLGRDSYVLLLSLDDLHQYMVGNVKAMVEERSPTEQALFEKNRQHLNTLLKFYGDHFDLPGATHFFDIADSLHTKLFHKHVTRIE